MLGPARFRCAPELVLAHGPRARGRASAGAAPLSDDRGRVDLGRRSDRGPRVAESTVDLPRPHLVAGVAYSARWRLPRRARALDAHQRIRGPLVGTVARVHALSCLARPA